MLATRREYNQKQRVTYNGSLLYRSLQACDNCQEFPCFWCGLSSALNFDMKPEMSSLFFRDNPSILSWLSASSAFWSQRKLLHKPSYKCPIDCMDAKTEL